MKDSTPRLLCTHLIQTLAEDLGVQVDPKFTHIQLRSGVYVISIAVLTIATDEAARCSLRSAIHVHIRMMLGDPEYADVQVYMPPALQGPVSEKPPPSSSVFQILHESAKACRFWIRAAIGIQIDAVVAKVCDALPWKSVGLIRARSRTVKTNLHELYLKGDPIVFEPSKYVNGLLPTPEDLMMSEQDIAQVVQDATDALGGHVPTTRMELYESVFLMCKMEGRRHPSSESLNTRLFNVAPEFPLGGQTVTAWLLSQSGSVLDVAKTMSIMLMRHGARLMLQKYDWRHSDELRARLPIFEHLIRQANPLMVLRDPSQHMEFLLPRLAMLLTESDQMTVYEGMTRQGSAPGSLLELYERAFATKRMSSALWILRRKVFCVGEP